MDSEPLFMISIALIFHSEIFFLLTLTLCGTFSQNSNVGKGRGGEVNTRTSVPGS